MEVIDRFLPLVGQSFFLLGPRGTGKSTWLRRQVGQALFIDLLDPQLYRAYQARPERLIEVVRGNPSQDTVVIDEIQKVPELLDAVHLLIEERSRLRFILTGSSTRKLRRAGVNLLAGRALRKTMHPFMAAELGDRFRLEQALRQGLVPAVLAAMDPEEVLRGYATLYLKEEVQAEGLVRNLGAFARFLEAVSFSHASLLNVSNLARECQVERKVAEGYVEVLEDLLLAWRLQVFSRRAARAVVAHPKLYLFDSGVFRSLRPIGPLDRPQEVDGAALEGLVAQHLRAWAAYSGERANLFFWRTRSGSEVDFVVYGPDEFWALEVKNSTQLRTQDLHGLAAFHDDYPESRQLLLYRGEEQRLVRGVLCMPCERFLRRLVPFEPLSRAIG
ncbi:MAG: ATP-binding protein [Deltaproteobacteria bacterium]|nr:ATP-binding protein [Deltaproteobacteria bacterium]